MPEAGEPLPSSSESFDAAAPHRTLAARFAPGARTRLVLAVAAGAAHALSFAPAGQPWLELLALAAALQFGLSAPRPRLAAGLGFAFGLGWFGVGTSWTYISLHGHGGLAAPLAVLATSGLVALLAAFPAAALAAGALAAPAHSLARGLALACAWTLSEWLRGVALTGFPWLAAGYAHTDSPLAGFAPLAGVYGVGAAAALLAVLALVALRALLVAPRRWRAAGAALAAAAAMLAAGAALRDGAWSSEHGRPIKVRLVQGNIPQDLKFGEGGMERAAGRYLPALPAQMGVTDATLVTAPATRAGAPDLIVFPESAFPAPINELPDYVLQAVGDAELRSGAALVFGIFIVEPGWRFYNSAIGLAGDAEPQRYSKRHLVPFGEFIPLGMHWFVQLLNIPIGDQEAGDRYQAPMALAGEQIAVDICFEDLFGAEIADAWHDREREPTLLLNLSNLAWFDDSIALPQDQQIARMRALETARPVLRATNTGISAIIDARGRVLAQLPIQVAGVLEGEVQGTSGATPFVRLGNAPVLLLASLAWLACRWRWHAPGRGARGMQKNG